MPEVVRRWLQGKDARENLTGFALCLIFFSPILIYLGVLFDGGTLLFEDGLLQSFPFRVFLRSAFVNGFSPQWVPFSACGFSLLAEGQNGICFPSTQIIYRIFSAESGWIVEMISIRTIAFAFCTIFLRHSNISRLGSLFGASVYTFCTATLPLEQVPAMGWCYALLPGIFLSCDRFIGRRPFSFVFLSAVFALILLTGHPVLIIYIGIVIAAYFIFDALIERPTARSFQEVQDLGLRLMGAILVATLIASPQLLPMIEEFRFSARTVGAGLSLDVLQDTLHLKPNWVPRSLYPIPFHVGEWAWTNTIRFPFYALFAVFVGMLFGARRPRRNYFILLALFSILMALGPYVGLWKVVHSLPVLKHFRFPYRWLFFLPVCISFLAAHGVDHLRNLTLSSPVGSGRMQKTLILTGLVTGAIFLFRYHTELLLQMQKAFESSLWIAGSLVLSTTVMVLAAFLSLVKQTRYGIALGVTATVISMAASLVYNNSDPLTIRDLSAIGWKGVYPPNALNTYRSSSAISPCDVWVSNTMSSNYHHTANLTILNGTFSTGYYFSFFPYWAANVSTWCQDALKGDREKQVYLNLASAKWLFGPSSSSSERPASPVEFLTYNNQSALPRASIVFSCRAFPDERNLISFLESPHEFDPRRELAILRRDAAAWNVNAVLEQPQPSIIPPEATIVVDRPDRVEVELSTAAPKGAFLVLNDTYYPGWRAMVDGAEKVIVRTNYAFRGIKLPEGAKRVVFFFDPLVPDAALPLPTLFLAALGGGISLRRCLVGKRDSGHRK